MRRNVEEQGDKRRESRRRRRRRAHASVCCFERENLKREMNTKVCLSLCV